jgi:hypothetical protein
MAIMDYFMEISDAQALGAFSNAAAVKGTNQMDLQTGDTDAWGTAVTTNRWTQDLKVNVTVHTALVGASASIDVELTSKAADVSISSGGTVHGIVKIPALSAAGYKTSISVPAQNLNRYVGLMYRARGGNVTSATLNAWFGPDSGEIHD